MAHPHTAGAPPTVFPLLPLRKGVLFPGVVVTLPIGRPRSVALVQSLREGDIFGVVSQRDGAIERPNPSDLHPVGTWVQVRRIVRKPNHFQLTVEGIERFKLTRLVESEPFLRTEGDPITPDDTDLRDAQVLADALRQQMQEMQQQTNGQITFSGTLPDDPSLLADNLAAALELTDEQQLEVLFTLKVSERLQLVARFLGEARARVELKHKIENEVRRGFGQNRREAMLREQMRAIQNELGEGSDQRKDADTLRDALEARDLPEEVQEVADRELTRLERINPNQAEYNVIRTYLEWIANLPWQDRATAAIDIEAIAQTLDDDHYGLDDVKKRILEHMAVMDLSGDAQGTILCLAGPPGVGKTSLGQSIADATQRPFVRIALGGVRDEAEIRGHRRTYIGALPGRLMHALRKANVKNPVILLDEIDKLGRGWAGDPEAALLEVLDPEQNNTFTDHYMELPFDLSEVLFICTANDLSALSPPLRDRLEIIELSGYTSHDKINIARNHLLPKQLTKHTLSETAFTLTDDALRRIVREYTREAGVRQLNRELQKICRSMALEIARDAERRTHSVEIDADDIATYLGKPRFFDEVAERTSVPGVATGLAWTPVGGDILFIETTQMPGKGALEITGKLGDVMKESARAALTYVRANADRLGVDANFRDNHDLHIHVPAGAVPKDGPSAGVTIFTALTSLLTGRKVRSDTAMTGEVTLRGRVLPVGGTKAKVLAAHRAGLTRVILPARNRRDVDDIPDDIRNAMHFTFATDMQEVLDAALEDNDLIDDVDVLDTTTTPETPSAAF